MNLSKLPNRIHSRIARLNFKARINGHTFKLPLFRPESAYYWSDPNLIATIEKYFRKGTTFIDVGVNIGDSLLAFKSIYPDEEYIGFDPNPTCISYSETLVSINGLRNVKLVPAALSDKDGVYPLYFVEDDQHAGTATIIEGFRKSPITRTTYVNHISSPPDITNKVSLIKIDVEGSELYVIKSLMGLIKRDRPDIICEILPACDEGRRARQDELELIIRVLGYHIQKLPGGEPVRAIPIESDPMNCDYLFSHTAGTVRTGR